MFEWGCFAVSSYNLLFEPLRELSKKTQLLQQFSPKAVVHDGADFRFLL